MTTDNDFTPVTISPLKLSGPKRRIYKVVLGLRVALEHLCRHAALVFMAVMLPKADHP